MGRVIPSIAAANLRDFARITDKLTTKTSRHKHRTTARFPPETVKSSATDGGSDQGCRKMQSSSEIQNRVPLSQVVSDCVKRWFRDTLREAKSGDSGMQILVGQMYYSGYGVTRDVQKGRAWITKASKNRSSVWKVSDKHPGYNASDSDSDEQKSDLK